jgi:lipoprotein NlpI
VQRSFQRLVQPLQLQALLLQGLVIQDKGAVLLAEALASTQRLQVHFERGLLIN